MRCVNTSQFLDTMNCIILVLTFSAAILWLPVRNYFVLLVIAVVCVEQEGVYEVLHSGCESYLSALHGSSKEKPGMLV